LVYLSFRPKRSHKTSLPRSTNTTSVGARKRPCTFRISPYTTVLCRITWFRIRIVSFLGRIRSNQGWLDRGGVRGVTPPPIVENIRFFPAKSNDFLMLHPPQTFSTLDLHLQKFATPPQCWLVRAIPGSNTIIYGEKWRAYTASVYEGSKGAFFFVNHCIPPYTTPRYTILIRDYVNRRISLYTVVYDHVCLTWVMKYIFEVVASKTTIRLLLLSLRLFSNVT